MGEVRTWHAPDVLGREGQQLLAKEAPPARTSVATPKPTTTPSTTAPKPPAAPQPNNARPPAKSGPVAFDELGWLSGRVGHRLELVFLDGSTVRGVLVRVGRFEIVLREEHNGTPAEVLALKGALAQVRET